MIENITWIKSGITISASVTVKIQKNIVCAKKKLFLESAKCSCENGKYARSIGNSVVIYDEIIEETRAIPTKSTSAKSVPTKSTSTNFYLLPVSL